MSTASLHIKQPAQIDLAPVVLTGYGSRTVRMLYKGQEIGFATTTYSHHMTDEMKAYAAERLMLLMTLAQGLSNEQIKMQIARRKAEQTFKGASGGSACTTG